MQQSNDIIISNQIKATAKAPTNSPTDAIPTLLPAAGLTADVAAALTVVVLVLVGKVGRVVVGVAARTAGLETTYLV